MRDYKDRLGDLISKWVENKRLAEFVKNEALLIFRKELKTRTVIAFIAGVLTTIFFLLYT